MCFSSLGLQESDMTYGVNNDRKFQRRIDVKLDEQLELKTWERDKE